MAFNGNRNILYISDGNTTSKIQTASINIKEHISNVPNNGIGIHPLTNKLFLSTSDFSTKGETFIYNFEKMHSDLIESGVGASYIYFAVN